MVSSEIKETIYIAVSAVLLAGLLTFVSYTMTLRSDIANFRNTEVYTYNSMNSVREFFKYNGQVLYGEDVVAAVRDYMNTPIRVGVKNQAGQLIYYMDLYKAKTTEGKDQLTLEHLHCMFPPSHKYTAVLVYGDVPLEDITLDDAVSGINQNISGIVFFHTGCC